MSKTPLLIAVVDDEEPIRRAMDRLLRSAGLLVETFTCGQDFLISLKDHQPDCLVLDLHMHSVNGFEVQAKLNAACMRVPTIIITGHDSTEARIRTLQAGAFEFLRKPVDGQMLLDAIDRAIEARPSPPATD